ncbi:long-chain fatty acid--CoA ligase [Microaerobacter geothermalis]|uniref:long-chain fatty acid--CoA ligase n=1 Tax=Microaerobacter geothermalis TaxID=674972 RepID=UPI001F33D944|nr:long-chain fatty acid--CoA ligase [Microaerobacter geothermalis]MCF6092607.1 long-chain fatty acid--CoA ligase [Microaerobacter geothermalis]
MMMDYPLTLKHIFDRAKTLFPKHEIVSRTSKGIFRYNYSDFHRRTTKLASALQKLGVKRGDKVATFAWNDHRHLECYFAIPCMGGVLHTINIRLSREHISYIANHAEDKVLFVDETLVPMIEAVQDQLKTVKAYVIMTDQMELNTSLSPAYSYEQLIEEGDENFIFPDDLDENDAAGMCFTSATTGNPKGVVYSHRGLFLHSMAIAMSDNLGVSQQDTLLPFVPMFHANAWGLPFACTMVGSKQVLPGPMPTPQVLLELFETEKVTVSAGVPTVWMGVLHELEKKSYDLSHLKTLICGGSAAPKSMIKTFREKYGISLLHAYGMTETTPLVFVSRIKRDLHHLSQEEQYDLLAKQGLLSPGVEMKVVGANGEVKWDGKEMGELLLRGPWIASEYYKDERTEETFRDGWLHTGDVVTVDEEGYVKIVDRTKDLVKSGGEWISTVDLENAIMGHEAVAEAAVVAVPHEKWQERPVACVVLKPPFKDKVDKEEIISFLEPQFPKWWLPDDVIFMDEIPKTTVGKFLKRALRDQVKSLYKSS